MSTPFLSSYILVFQYLPFYFTSYFKKCFCVGLFPSSFMFSILFSIYFPSALQYTHSLSPPFYIFSLLLSSPPPTLTFPSHLALILFVHFISCYRALDLVRSNLSLDFLSPLLSQRPPPPPPSPLHVFFPFPFLSQHFFTYSHSS